MAVGAQERYWKAPGLQGYLKHNILRRYLPVFLHRTSSVGGEAAYFDGYAGRGKYQDGTLGTAGQMLEFAIDARNGRGKKRIELFLSEMDRDSYAPLNELCERYRENGLSVVTECGDAGSFLRSTLPQISHLPTFLFLDPCGVGIPFTDLVDAANRSGGKAWPPTEFVLNFSTEAIRRIGGHVKSDKVTEASMDRLSVSVGGEWWKHYFQNDYEHPDVEVVREFSYRLSEATNMTTFAVPVRRQLRHQPIYYLIFGTRHLRGLWNFAHSVASTTEEWRKQSQEVIDGDQLSLDPDFVPNLAQVEKEALPIVKQNIVELLDLHGEFTLGDYPIEVFGRYLGEVRASVGRAAVKELFKEGMTSTTGKGGKPEDLVIRPV